MFFRCRFCRTQYELFFFPWWTRLRLCFLALSWVFRYPSQVARHPKRALPIRCCGLPVCDLTGKTLRERLTVSIKASCSECMLIAECVWAFFVTALFSRLGYDDLTVRWQPMVDFYDTGYELSSLSLRHVTFFTAFIRVSSDAEVGDKHTHPFPQPLISLISHQLHVQWDKGSLSGHCW